MRKHVYINRYAADLGEPCIMVGGAPCSEAVLSGDVRVLYRPHDPIDDATVYVACDHVEVTR